MLPKLSNSIVQITALLIFQSCLISAVPLETSFSLLEPLSKRAAPQTSAAGGIRNAVQFGARPAEPPKCPVPSPYGKPPALHCRAALQQMEGDPSNRPTVYQTRIWSQLQGQNEDIFSTLQADYVTTPRIWSYGECAIQLDIIPRTNNQVLMDLWGLTNGRGGITQDVATKNVIKHAAKSVLDNCVNVGPKVGGTIIAGYFNSIGITVYQQQADPSTSAQVNSAVALKSCESAQAGKTPLGDVTKCPGFGGTSASNDPPDSGPTGMDSTQYALSAPLGAAACSPDVPGECGWGSECKTEQSSIGSVLWGIATKFGSCIDSGAIITAGCSR
ncbi:MAG: hypothetical protein M1812_002944 [Candelaria pacifica]|nr:MAG: hypothetical protein M1812_002944 [Candelaria pacifica]